MNHLDSSDFIELVIKHLIRDKASFIKAKELGITVDDFGDPITGIAVYREFVSIVLEVNDSPIVQDVFLNLVKTKIEQNKIHHASLDQITQFIEYIYTTELSSEYICNSLAEFIKRKRTLKLQVKHKEDLDTFAVEYSKLVDDLTISNTTENIQVINPFETIVRRSNTRSIPTGLTRVDAIIQGLGIQELALVMAASGGGKTATATVLTKNAAVMGYKVLYLSIEEPAVNVTQRLYANVLKESYQNLYQGIITEEHLNQKLSELDAHLRQNLVNNLRVVDLRDLAPLKPETLWSWLEKYCEENDFWPDLLIGDQLEFFASNTLTKSEWEMYQQVMFQLWQLVSTKICGKKEFSMYLLHQLNEMKLNYTTKEISGFKGVIRKCALAIVLGRKDPTNPLMNIHSLKARNSANFKLNYRANFEFMDILDDAPTDNRQQNLAFNQDENNPPLPPLPPTSAFLNTSS
jgi:hypothetical protein